MRRQREGMCTRRMIFKVFMPNGKRVTTVMRAPAGRIYTEKGADEALMAAAEDLEKQFPNLEFRVAQVGPGQFNFICVGERTEVSHDAIVDQDLGREATA